MSEAPGEPGTGETAALRAASDGKDSLEEKDRKLNIVIDNSMGLTHGFLYLLCSARLIILLFFLSFYLSPS